MAQFYNRFRKIMKMWHNGSKIGAYSLGGDHLLRPIMNRTTPLVNNLSFAELLTRSSLRTLFTIAFYQEAAVGHRVDQPTFAASLAAQVPHRPWPAYLRAL